MHQQLSDKHYDPDRLLDTLRERLGLDSDQALARHLHICPKTISKIRSGEIQLSATILLCMAECAATSMDELRGIVGERRRIPRRPYKIAA
jgi:plasmid maintenance system antidote protein VapI